MRLISLVITWGSGAFEYMSDLDGRLSTICYNMEKSRFTHINDSFECAHCGRQVPPRARGCRNHCPYCLTSRHVDINPGDRANPCDGLMDAVGYELNAKKGIVLVFRCRRCQTTARNMAANEDSNAPDDYDLILRLKKPLADPRGWSDRGLILRLDSHR